MKKSAFDKGNKNIILNLCDRPINRITSIFQNAENPFIIGSYTCGNYFEYLINNIDVTFLKDKDFDIVYPVLPEHKLILIDDAKALKLCDMAKNVVVNDYGLLEYFYGKYNLRLGRILLREYRDRRYNAYENSEYSSKIFDIISDLNSRGFDINATELDMAVKNMNADINGIKRYFHFPLRQISASHICEFASINVPIEKKFVPDQGCAYQCLKTMIYSDSGYVKIGKNVFDIIDSSFLENMREDDFVIYNDIGELHGYFSSSV